MRRENTAKDCQRTLARGEWGRPSGEALIDRTALVIGLGAVVQALASRLVPLGMPVMATDVISRAETAARLKLDCLEDPSRLDDMLPMADFLISTVTLTEETEGLLNHRVFNLMKPTAYVINISRGPIVNETDLLKALNHNRIAGAGLDVLSQEPPGVDHPLVHHEKVVVTPHTAGVIKKSFEVKVRPMPETSNGLNNK